MRHYVSLVRTTVRRDNNDVSWSKRLFIMVLSWRISVLGGDGWEIEGVGSVGGGVIHFKFECG
jgi:hypothetical protein